ncbi:hypothetical protein [Amycolatopsis sp. NPDC051061]|uniref:hypothetical protein n=1 Tax=Amycolatopsis sp. NPDC051061 TaxID=3155042 RepID=UPI0034138E9D
MLMTRAEVDGRLVDVRVGGEAVTELGGFSSRQGETVLDAEGGALLPGLHDHHVHLLSMAAAAESVRTGHRR